MLGPETITARVDDGQVVLEGPPLAVAHARRLLVELYQNRGPEVRTDLRLLELSPTGSRNLGIETRQVLVKTTVILSENGRPIQTYSEPSQAHFRTSSGGSKP